MARGAALRNGQIRTVDLSDRDLGPREVRIKVTLAGVNYWEVLQKRGQVPVIEPGILGSEGVGVVVSAGPDVTDLPVGARVAWSKLPGSYADEVVGAETLFHRVPEEVDDETAAGLLFQGMTAHYLAADAWPLERGDVAVVTAAAGGVGLLLTQLLVSRGVRVIGVVSSPAKESAVTDAGAALALNYGPDLSDRVRAAAPDGVAAIYDSVGGDVARELLGALRVRGALVLYGSASGSEAAIGPSDLGTGSFYLTRASGRDYARDPHETSARARALFTLAARGHLQVRVAGIWRLDKAGEALRALESRTTTGKLLIAP
jgi:NADPH:quinone reductase